MGVPPNLARSGMYWSENGVPKGSTVGYIPKPRPAFNGRFYFRVVQKLVTLTYIKVFVADRFLNASKDH